MHLKKPNPKPPMTTSASKRAFAVLTALLLQTAAVFGIVTITGEPSPVTSVADGAKITLQVIASSDVPGKTLSYQWFKLNGLIYEAFGSASSSNALIFASAKTTNAGTYKVIVSENGSFPAVTAESAEAVVVVNMRPKITVQPVSLPSAVTEGGPAPFTVTVDAAGATPFSYTWQKKVGSSYVTVGVPVSKPDLTDTLTLTNVQLADAGSYRVSITNPSGIVVNSKEAVLKVNSRPVITTPHATALTVVFGSSSTLKVVVGGNAPFTYIWFKNDVAIPNSNKPILAIKGTNSTAPGVAEGPGNYKVRITNAITPDVGLPGEQATESAQVAVVQVIHKPKIVTQPLKATIDITAVPQSPNLTVLMDTFGPEGNEGTLQYQWLKDGKIIADTLTRTGTNAATLAFTNFSWADRGSYKVVVKNEVGSVTSASAVLTILSPPTIISEPVGPLFGATGGSIKMNIVAGGSTPLVYAWRFRPAGQVLFNDKVLSKTASLSLTKLSAASVGEYQCTITNAPKGAAAVPAPVLSSLIYLQVDNAPKITQQTSVLPYNNTPGLVATPNIPALPGNKLHLKVVADPSTTDRPADLPPVPPAPAIPANPLTYQWLVNNQIIVGANAAELIIDPVQVSNSGKYSCIIQNFSGKVTSKVLTIVVSGPPTITAQPLAATVIEESPIETTVAATGKPPLKYKWQKQATGPGGTFWQDVPGKTLAKLSIGISKLEDNGTYKCIVTDSFGPTESNEVQLTINPIPPPTLGPVSGLSTVEYFPTIARASEQVRIFGDFFQYTKSVTFGTVPATSYIIESDHSLLVTVPANAPLAPTPITVATKNGSTNTTIPFTRTTDFANELPNTTILTVRPNTQVLKDGDNRFAETIFNPLGYVYYLVHLEKRSQVIVFCAGGNTGTANVDPGLYAWVETTGANSFFGPDGVTRFPTNTPYVSSFVGFTSETVSFSTGLDDLDILIGVRSSNPPGFGLAGFGPFTLRVSVTPVPPGTPPPANPPPTSAAKLAMSYIENGSEAARKDVSSDFGLVFGNELTSSEPQLLWEAEESSGTSARTTAHFSLSLQAGAAEDDDQFGWQLLGTDGNALGSLWVNAMDGSVRLAQPDGTVQSSTQSLTPGADAYPVEVILDPLQGVWTATIGGQQVSQPLSLPPGSQLGSIYGVWDLGSDGQSSGASIILDNLSVEATSAP